MRGNQCFSESGDVPHCAGIQHQLVWIGAPIVADRDGFSTPDQLSATFPEAPPTPPDCISGMSVGGPVPAFHWQNSETGTDVQSADITWLRERRWRPRLHK